MQKEQKITAAFLQEMSVRTGLIFSNMLGAVVLEEIVRLICESEYAKEFWLRNGNILTRESYERNLKLKLEYDYVIQKPKKELGDFSPLQLLNDIVLHLKEEVLEGNSKKNILLEVKIKSNPKFVQLDCVGKIEDMQVPVKIVFHCLQDENLIPKKNTLSLLVYPEKQITYYSFPAENILVEKYLEVITKLELIRDMRAYYDIYYLLDRESVDGRKIRDYICGQCEIMKIEKDNSRFEMVKNYQNYGYMKKKWKVFLRSIHRKEPGWEQVIQRFINFFEPIWKAIIDDYVFFGDWMPELNRFL